VLICFSIFFFLFLGRVCPIPFAPANFPCIGPRSLHLSPRSSWIQVLFFALDPFQSPSSFTRVLMRKQTFCECSVAPPLPPVIDFSTPLGIEGNYLFSLSHCPAEICSPLFSHQIDVERFFRSWRISDFFKETFPFHEVSTSLWS